MRQGIKRQATKTHVNSDWFGRRKDSKFRTGIQAALKIAPVDEFLTREIEKVDDLFNWLDDMADILSQRVETLEGVSAAYEKLADVLLEIYNYENCNLTKSATAYATVCSEMTPRIISEYKEKLAKEIVIIENYQDNNLMQLVNLVEDRQTKKHDFEHYSGKVEKLGAIHHKKQMSGKQLSESEKEKMGRNQEKFESANEAWEEVKHRSVNDLQVVHDARFNHVDNLVSEHARNEIHFTSQILLNLESVINDLETAHKLDKSSFTEPGSLDEGASIETASAIKQKKGFMGRTVKSKFLAETKPCGEDDFDSILYKLDFLYITAEELLEAVEGFCDIFKVLIRSSQEQAMEFENFYGVPGPDLRDLVKFYSGTWTRFESTFTTKVDNLAGTLAKDVKNYQLNLIKKNSAKIADFHKKKKEYDHYKAKLKKLEGKNSSKYEKNLQKFNDAEGHYTRAKTNILQQMTAAFTSRFQFLDYRFYDFAQCDYQYYKALNTSILPMIEMLPELDENAYGSNTVDEMKPVAMVEPGAPPISPNSSLPPPPPSSINAGGPPPRPPPSSINIGGPPAPPIAINPEPGAQIPADNELSWQGSSTQPPPVPKKVAIINEQLPPPPPVMNFAMATPPPPSPSIMLSSTPPELNSISPPIQKLKRFETPVPDFQHFNNAPPSRPPNFKQSPSSKRTPNTMYPPSPPGGGVPPPPGGVPPPPPAGNITTNIIHPPPPAPPAVKRAPDLSHRESKMPSMKDFESLGGDDTPDVWLY